MSSHLHMYSVTCVGNRPILFKSVFFRLYCLMKFDFRRSKFTLTLMLRIREVFTYMLRIREVFTYTSDVLI